MGEINKLVIPILGAIALAVALWIVGEPIPLDQGNAAFQSWLAKIGILTSVIWVGEVLVWVRITP